MSCYAVLVNAMLRYCSVPLTPCAGACCCNRMPLSSEATASCTAPRLRKGLPPQAASLSAPAAGPEPIPFDPCICHTCCLAAGAGAQFWRERHHIPGCSGGQADAQQGGQRLPQRTRGPAAQRTLCAGPGGDSGFWLGGPQLLGMLKKACHGEARKLLISLSRWGCLIKQRN